jgi:hypothetical protein
MAIDDRRPKQFLISRAELRLSPLCMWPLIDLWYQPRMIDEYGVFGGMRIGKGNLGKKGKK